MVVSELRGEKIDIIPWNTEPARFVAKALSPARVREVYIDDETKEATVIVPDDQLALAIGKEGLNARLATRLCGWKIDIQSETEFAQAEAEAAFAGDADGEEFSGRCSAILSNGKRCPNAALPASQYCGVPAHQALATAEPAASNGDGDLGEGEPGEEAAEAVEASTEAEVAEPVAEAEVEIAEAEAVATEAVSETPEAEVEIAEAEEVATEAVAVVSEPETAEIAEDGTPEPKSPQDES
jgi:N utilization substance protein A